MSGRRSAVGSCFSGARGLGREWLQDSVMNKWVLLSCFLLWARHGEGGALKCLPEDEACSAEQTEQIEQQEIEIRRPIGADADAPAECLPGSEWDSNCHNCRCSAEGAADCLKRPDCEYIEEPIRCKPNSTFTRECNTCVCLENGLGLCTVKPCQRISSETSASVKSKASMPRGVTCAPGTKWLSQCNNCLCLSNGLSSCTDMACSDKETEAPLDCAPHSQWRRDCNMCWCTPSGRAMCTKMGCGGSPVVMNFDDKKGAPENPPEMAVKSAPKNGTKKVCVENRMFIMNCNTCWCNEDGTSYFCTRKVCVQDSEEPVIEEGKPESLRIIKKECRPDEVFELDCNMCRCNADGTSFSCTRRACFDEEHKNVTRSRKVRATPQEAPKTCHPGQEFRLDCNKCLCDNEGQDFSCTRIDCAALNSNNGARSRRDVTSQKLSEDCEPGSVFDQGCNVCRCTDDGGHATCTLKRCVQSKENSTGSATETSFRCNPGEQFKQSCKDCSCSADGKSVFCTLMVCDQDLTPQ